MPSTALTVVLVVLALLLIYIVSVYNRLRRLNLGVKESFSAMDVFLKKRYDLIPNLVEAVKGYAAHERETLEETIRARSKAMQANSTEEAVEANNELAAQIGKLVVIAENYPELKADGGFLKLQRQLESVEEDIANARLYYNGNVKLYNTSIQLFPAVLLANLFGFKEEAFFAAAGSDRAVPTTFEERA